MTLVDNDQIKEIPGVFTIEAGAACIPGDSLVDGEVHLPALDRLTLDLVAGITKGGEGLVLGVIDQHIAIGEK